MAIIKVFNVNLGHNKGYCLTFCSQKFLMTDLGLCTECTTLGRYPSGRDASNDGGNKAAE